MLGTRPPQPPLCFRVGITGTRDAQAAEAARPAIAQILTLVADEISGLAVTEKANVYHTEADDKIHPKLVLISPLAEGADRVAAEEALQLGYSLRAPLPFAQAKYESDFPHSIGEFRRLLSRADTIVLDGALGDYRERSYEAVGCFVVNNSDLLIAVWDAEPTTGGGGTGDIVELAVDLGVPVVHLPVESLGQVRLIETRLHLRADPAEGEMAVDLEEAEVQTPAVGVGEPRLIETWLDLRRTDLRGYTDGLRRLMSRTVLPPPAPDRWGLDPRRPALEKYWQEKVPDVEPRRVIGSVVIWPLIKLGVLLERATTFRSQETLDPMRMAPTAPGPHGAAEEWWTKSYEAADRLSAIYGERYRLCYLLVLILGLVGLSMAALAASLKVATVIACISLAFMVVTFGAWACNQLFRWHQRWISYRLLAELCRKQRALTPLGRSLPRWEIEHLASEADTRDEAWVGWYFSAMARAAPFSCEILEGAALERARRAGLALLQEQIDYHVKRGRECKGIGLALYVLSPVLFFAAFICAVLKLSHELHFPAVLSALAAFFFGIRAYAEPELLADQSARMVRVLLDTRNEMEEVRFDWPLASQDLGARIFRTATLMMQDIRGWAQLFRVKQVEAQ